MRKCCVIIICINALISLTTHAVEQINSFKSTIIINKDATLTVTETISVISENNTIIHGLVREFPTRYKTQSGTQATVNFYVNNITLDDHPEPYQLKDRINGIALYIGSPNRIISRGLHTYTITYTTDWQIGFFNNHDELYWNVTGNGWRLPILYACADITLPHAFPENDIQATAYTGKQGSQGKAYTSMQRDDQHWFFETTQRIPPGSGFTIALGWPKGYVKEPTTIDRLLRFIHDNLLLVWSLLFLLILIIIYISGLIRTRTLRMPNVVIPEFFPPQKLTPGAIRYITTKKLDHKIITADIINLAVRGYLTITYKTGALFGGTYILTKNDTSEKISTYSLNNDEQMLYNQLFKSHNSFTLQESNRNETQKLVRTNNDILQKKYNNSFNTTPPLLWRIIKVTLIMIIGSVMIHSFNSTLSDESFTIALIANGIALILVGCAWHYFWLYAPEIQAVADHIAGFKMFLEATETERLNLMGAPDRTPEQYEQYLPYAIALDVEKPWSKQFAPVFEKLSTEGHPYVPLWYIGPTGRMFDAQAMSNSLNSTLSTFSQPISSSSSAPGSRSGFGGGGSSGGGGGGGGGGGW
jgi:uncharacterized membrane protein YgcG